MADFLRIRPDGVDLRLSTTDLVKIQAALAAVDGPYCQLRRVFDFAVDHVGRTYTCCGVPQ